MPLAPDRAKRAVREVVQGPGGRGRPLGVVLQPRPVLDAIGEVLQQASPGGVVTIEVRGPAGSGLRTLWMLAARMARLEGFVPLAVPVLERRPWLADALVARHVALLVDHRVRHAGALHAVAAFVARLGAASTRRHVLIKFGRLDYGNGRTLQLDRMGSTAMHAMVYRDRADGPSLDEVRDGIEVAEGVPGALVAQLRAVPFERRTAPIALVHESTAPYVISPAPRDVARRRVGAALDRAVARAGRLAAAGRHAAAVRLLDRAGRVLEGRADHPAAAHCALALGWLHRDRGRSDAALHCFERSRALAAASPLGVRATMAIGIVWTDQNRLLDAEALLRSAQSAAALLQHEEDERAATTALARALLWQGRIDEAAALLAPTLTGDATVSALAIAARVQVAAGATDRAGHAASRALEGAVASASPRDIAVAARAMVLVRAAVGDVHGARQAALDGLAAAAAAHLPLLALRLRAAWLGAARSGDDSGHRGDGDRGSTPRSNAWSGISGSPSRCRCQRCFVARSRWRSGVRRRLARRLRRTTAQSPICGTGWKPPRPRQTIAPLCRHSPTRSPPGCVPPRLWSSAPTTPGWSFAPGGRGAATRAWRSRLSRRPRPSVPPGRRASAPSRSVTGEKRLGRSGVAGRRESCWTWTVPAAWSAPRRWRRRRACGAWRIEHPRRSPDATWEDLLGTSPSAGELRRAILNAARAPFPVLILGESGSGKELVARAIHRLGPRRHRRLCAINCAALSDELVEAELFGHAKGAFTGALTARAGLFEAADRRHAVPRRDRRAVRRRCRPSCCACCRSGEVGGSARTCRVASTCASSPPPTAISSEQVATGGSARTCYFRLDVIRSRAAAARARRATSRRWRAFWRELPQRRIAGATLAPDAVRRADALRLARQRARAAERHRGAGGARRRGAAASAPDHVRRASAGRDAVEPAGAPRSTTARQEFERRTFAPRWRAPADTAAAAREPRRHRARAWPRAIRRLGLMPRKCARSPDAGVAAMMLQVQGMPRCSRYLIRRLAADDSGAARRRDPGVRADPSRARRSGASDAGRRRVAARTWPRCGTQLGLDRPLLAQYGSFLAGRCAATSATRSATARRWSREIRSRAVPHDVQLALAAMAVAMVMAIPLGHPRRGLSRHGRRPRRDDAGAGRASRCRTSGSGRSSRSCSRSRLGWLPVAGHGQPGAPGAARRHARRRARRDPGADDPREPARRAARAVRARGAGPRPVADAAPSCATRFATA